MFGLLVYCTFNDYLWELDLNEVSADPASYEWVLQKTKIIGGTAEKPLVGKGEEIIVDKQGGYTDYDDLVCGAIAALHHHMYIDRRELED